MVDNDRCIFCKNNCLVTKDEAINYIFNCEICGRFKVTQREKALLKINPPKCPPKISAVLRHKTLMGEPLVTIGSTNINNLLTVEDLEKEYPEDYIQRLEKILINLRKLSDFRYAPIEVKETSYPIFFMDSNDINALSLTLWELVKEDYILRDSVTIPDIIRLTSKGLSSVHRKEPEITYHIKDKILLAIYEEEQNDEPDIIGKITYSALGIERNKFHIALLKLRNEGLIKVGFIEADNAIQGVRFATTAMTREGNEYVRKLLGKETNVNSVMRDNINISHVMGPVNINTTLNNSNQTQCSSSNKPLISGESFKIEQTTFSNPVNTVKLRGDMTKTNLSADITWLHLSDLHLLPSSSDTYLPDKVLKALLETLKRDLVKPDLIFITGDIINRGEKDYSNAEKFFDDLLDASGLSKLGIKEARRRLFIVPGNHDVIRAEAEYLKRTLIDYNESIRFFNPEAISGRSKFFKRFDAYQGFFNSYFEEIRNFDVVNHYYTELLEIKGLSLGIIGLNSCWFAQGPEENDDEHKLWIGERTFDEAFRSLSRKGNTDLALILYHHPTSWLHPEELDKIDEALAKTADILLYGHIHANKTRDITNPSGRVLEFQAGSAYGNSNHPHRALFGFIDIDNCKLTIKPIKYKDGYPGTWTLDTSLYKYNAPHYTETYDLQNLAKKKLI